jgi:threonine synthase
MKMSPFFIRCIDCGSERSFSPSSVECPKCGSQWAQAIYDYTAISKHLILNSDRRNFSLWRYKELLPVKNIQQSVTLGEGGTPLSLALNLGMMLGNPNIYIKDERQGPTTSFKDRQAAVTIAALKEAGITEMVVASTGNVAIAYSAYAARAGIKLWAFVTSLVPTVKMREIALYGSQLVKVTGSYDQAKEIASEFARQRNLYLDMGSRTIPSIEGMKTISFEIAEQLNNLFDQDSEKGMRKSAPWASPDWYIQSVSGGMGPLGVGKGFLELKEMGLISKLPRMAIIQAEGCAPMVQAWKNNADKADPVLAPNTRIETLATGDPGRSYTLLRKLILNNQGTFESVSDEEAYRAMHILAKMEGISMEPAAGVAFAGLFKLIRSGEIKSSEVVVINCSGHTIPTEPYLLGENWSKDIEYSSFKDQSIPQEGLLAALSGVAPDRFPKILIVDDSEDACRLIRRILQSQGNFSVTEVKSGREALSIINSDPPDLLILDLMMPDMDGFTVLNEIRSKSDTENIPVIVSTAKELTPLEKEMLKGQIKVLLQKGDFLSDDFLHEVQTIFEE